MLCQNKSHRCWYTWPRNASPFGIPSLLRPGWSLPPAFHNPGLAAPLLRRETLVGHGKSSNTGFQHVFYYGNQEIRRKPSRKHSLGSILKSSVLGKCRSEVPDKEVHLARPIWVRSYPGLVERLQAAWPLKMLKVGGTTVFSVFFRVSFSH